MNSIIQYPYIKQLGESDCGITCLAMIFKTYMLEIPIQQLSDISGNNLAGVSALGLKKCAEMFNFNVTALNANNKIWTNSKMTYPTIAHLLIENHYAHYVVIYGFKNEKLIIADPIRGMLNKTIKEFSKEWTGVVLIITPSNRFVPTQNKTVI